MKNLMNSSLAELTRRCVVISESPINGRMLHSVVANHMVKTRKDSCLCDYVSILALLFFSSTSVLSFNVDYAVTAMMHI
jgi:hypothetical protein